MAAVMRTATLIALLLTACDGGASPDAGPDGRRDAATATDAGAATDASTVRDAAAALDAGGDDDAGLTADAGAADSGVSSRDPAAAGPLAVDASRSETLDRGGRSIPITVHMPAGDGRVPLVLLLPGFQVSSAQYTTLANRVASHGFVVVRAEPEEGGGFVPNPDHVEMAGDGRAVIDWAIGNLAGRVDPERVGVMGHSLGGKLAFMIAAGDPRVDAIFGVDPVNGGGGPGMGYTTTRPDIVPELVERLTVPIGLPGELFSSTGGGGFSMACAPADQNYQTFYDAATASPWVVQWTLEGADHMDFVDDRASCGTACSVCAAGPADPATVRDATATLAAAFFLRYLASDAAMDAWLTGASVPPIAADRSMR